MQLLNKRKTIITVLTAAFISFSFYSYSKEVKNVQTNHFSKRAAVTIKVKVNYLGKAAQGVMVSLMNSGKTVTQGTTGSNGVAELKVSDYNNTH